MLCRAIHLRTNSCICAPFTSASVSLNLVPEHRVCKLVRPAGNLPVYCWPATRYSAAFASSSSCLLDQFNAGRSLKARSIGWGVAGAACVMRRQSGRRHNAFCWPGLTSKHSAMQHIDDDMSQAATALCVREWRWQRRRQQQAAVGGSDATPNALHLLLCTSCPCAGTSARRRRGRSRGAAQTRLSARRS